MSFSHSAYSTMNLAMAREVLVPKAMPQMAGRRKRAKTSAHTANVNLEAVSHCRPWASMRSRRAGCFSFAPPCALGGVGGALFPAGARLRTTPCQRWLF
jgi:hypothetical protein